MGWIGNWIWGVGERFWDVGVTGYVDMVNVHGHQVIPSLSPAGDASS